MFSNVIEKLRSEAEKTTKSNVDVLREAESLARNELRKFGGERYAEKAPDTYVHEMIARDQAYVISGEKAKDRLEVVAGSAAVTGVLGLVGGAVALQSAALGGIGVLATAGSALGALGTVAVAGAALSVPLVVALGVAAAGAALMIIGKAIPVNHGAIDQTRSDVSAMVNAARETPGENNKQLHASNWLAGAKNLITNAIAVALFPEKPLEKNMGKTANAEQKALTDAHANQKKWGEVAPLAPVPDGARIAPNGMFIGLVVEVSKDYVIQCAGRNDYVAHNAADFGTKTPKVGEPLNVNVKNGKATVVPAKEVSLSKSAGR